MPASIVEAITRDSVKVAPVLSDFEKHFIDNSSGRDGGEQKVLGGEKMLHQKRRDKSEIKEKESCIADILPTTGCANERFEKRRTKVLGYIAKKLRRFQQSEE